ncbi:thioredoxin-like protein [Linnemannia elongata AG-77]|uniref:Thioredoxin-like protein n=1 Tax=Linnemannia elongata AG-77 TaxID=1314771 RepID=A0A197KEA2_9FUNG|nr:thioredoxin-like protein [Linnemannia elongata AG-77]
MEALSTKPKPKNVITTIVRSRRFRVLALVAIAFYCVFYTATIYRSGADNTELSTGEGKSLTQQGHSGHTEVDGEGEPLLVDADQDVPETPTVALERRIQGLIDQNRVMVFSKTYCPYSAAAKKLLKTYTNDFGLLEVDLEPKGDDIKRILTKITHGHSTFPSIFFAGESIGGRDKLQAIEDKHELRGRLDALGVKMLQ